jgi:hypothetical protein
MNPHTYKLNTGSLIVIKMLGKEYFMWNINKMLGKEYFIWNINKMKRKSETAKVSFTLYLLSVSLEKTYHFTSVTVNNTMMRTCV